MKRLNNKGQVLVCFIILIPIILLALTLVINLGLFSIEKRRVTNTVKDTISYGLKHIDDNNLSTKLNSLLLKNIDDITLENIKIELENSYIKINVHKDYKGLLSGFNNNLKIDVTYEGNVNDSGIKINKEANYGNS